ncbi:hypothetical protein [Marinimicrobium locisalis]|uniref:hypothetical protein n=1 Tax=Marinimicrobium locisalis TaxID=546022 RepID=UPI003221965F
MKFNSPLVLLILFMAGCGETSNRTLNDTGNEESSYYTPVKEECALPLGTIFQDCVSEDWFPSYWRSPVKEGSGREVRADEEVDHYVEVTVIEAGESSRGNVLDVQYGYEPTNASVRFKPVSQPSGFVDLSEFETGSLQFDIRIRDWGFATGLSMKVECGWPCTSEAIKVPLAPLNEWRRVEVPVGMLVERGLDLSRVNSAIDITPTWNASQGIHYQLDNVRWVDEPADGPLEVSNRNWAKLAKRDLDFIYHKALENHPGAIDTQNPDFREYLDDGYEAAVASVGKVETARDYADLIQTYMDGFNDGHFKVSFHRMPRDALGLKEVEQASLKVRNRPELASIERLEEGIYWVSLPSFQIQSPDHREAMEHLIDRLGKLPEDSVVVFDVRWNGGGSSAWGVRILEALYGSSALARLRIREGEMEHYSEFRVSKGNANYHRKRALSVGSKDPLYESAKRHYQGISLALREGREWYSPNSDSALSKWLMQLWSNVGSVNSSITPVLVTSGSCVSACLDFSDLVVRLPNVRHVGRGTGSDTLYIDVRLPQPQLPSGLGKLMLPMKVWRKRFRGHNETYMPEARYPGDIYDTPEVQQWVLDRI